MISTRNPTMLKIRLVYPNKKGHVVYIRTYRNDGQLFETVEQRDKLDVVLMTWYRVFQHWFNRNDMATIKRDSERRGWQTIEYNFR